MSAKPPFRVLVVGSLGGSVSGLISTSEPVEEVAAVLSKVEKALRERPAGDRTYNAIVRDAANAEVPLPVLRQLAGTHPTAA